MLLLALNFGFHPGACLTPLVHDVASLLVATLLSKFAILALKPHVLELLLDDVVSRVVVEVVRAALKSVLCREFHFLHLAFFIGQIGGPERLEGVPASGFLCVLKARLLHVRDSVGMLIGASLGAVVSH